jgi:UDP-N-acetylmuramoyl-L-alanyl-D-glutamate--2,6-diaminopimelate ligase
MLKQGKKLVRDVIKMLGGEGVILKYHKILAYMAAVLFGNPSKKMFVVAVTGTKGKTSTLNFLWHVLTAGGYKVGLVSTANIKIGEKEIKNWYHMTMPGRFLLQRFLYQMNKERCDIVLVEATSEGIKMNRHVGLYYDVAVLTNIFPEHLKSHNNSFEEYKKAKGLLFKNLIVLPKKRWNGMDVEKLILVNGDDKNADYFLDFPADKKFSYGGEGSRVENGLNVDYKFTNVVEGQFSTKFNLEEESYELALPGRFNIYNAMPAILLAKYLQIDADKINSGLKNCTVIPGRMEKIEEGQNFTCVVDYAHEAVSMENAINALLSLKKSGDNKLIVVFGGDGGGREPRTEMVRVISKMADVGIITLSDPFDTDPQIINDYLMGKAVEFGMEQDRNIFETIDRRVAIRKAISMSNEGDVILFACKGAEQTIEFKDGSVPWDDREEVRKALKEILQK